MFTVISITSSKQDNTGNPEIDNDVTYDVHLFDSPEQADAWITEDQAAHPPTEDGGTHYFSMNPIDHRTPQVAPDISKAKLAKGEKGKKSKKGGKKGKKS